MSHRASKWAAKAKGVSGARRNVLNALAAASDGYGRVCKTIEQISTMSAVSRRSAMASVQWLEAAGLIEKVRRRSGEGRQGANLITLLIDSNPECKICTLPECNPCTRPECNLDYSGQSAKSAPIYITNNNPQHISSGTPSKSSQDEDGISLEESNIIFMARIAGR